MTEALYPDGKAQITGYYDENMKLKKIKYFTISYQNDEQHREEMDTLIKNKCQEICNEYNIDICTYIKIYCKVTPISLVFPFKIGEFFRMYCYGMELESMLKSIVIIIFDRFMDTLALVTILLLIIIFKGGYISLFTYLLFLFLISILIIYLAYPGIYKFWKKYTLKSIATEKNLSILKILDIFNNIYLQITNISKGRGMILYCMSIIAWLCEIVGLVLLCGTTENICLNENIINYLSSAMRKGSSIELQHF